MEDWCYLENGGKRLVLPWHRRAGKDDVALHWTCVSAHQKVGTYWHMLPQYAQGKKAIWEAVNPHTGKRRIDEAFPKELRKRTDNQTMTIEFKCGSMWHVVGSDNYNALVGAPPVGVTFSEWALADPAAWAYIRPILDENGGWAIWIYTSRGRNHGFTMYQLAQKTESWRAHLLSADDTNIFTPEQLTTARQEYIALYGQDLGEMLFNQEYYTSFEGAVMGAYYAKELVTAERDKRITRVPYDKAAGVETAWDLGMDDPVAIWFFQRIGQEIHMIDYYEKSGEGLEHYAKILQEKGYVYTDHWAPHDIEVRELGPGKSRFEQARALGIHFRIVPNLPLMDGINNSRSIMSRCWFDEEKCARGIDCLRSYHAEWDNKQKTWRARPEHDWSSHGADAFRYLGLSRSQSRRGPAVAVPTPRYGRLR